MSKKFQFRGSFDKQYGKRAKALLKSASQHFYLIHWSLQSQTSSKKSLLLTWEIFAEEKYVVLNREKLAIPIQKQLSQKQKTFSESFAAFLKFRLNFKFLENKYDPHRFRIPELMDCVNLVR